MRTVSSTFQENSTAPNRKPNFELNIDWTGTGIKTNEKQRVTLIEVERALSEPFGGIQTAVADLIFNNNGNRFTPR